MLIMMFMIMMSSVSRTKMEKGVAILFVEIADGCWSKDTRSNKSVIQEIGHQQFSLCPTLARTTTAFFGHALGKTRRYFPVAPNCEDHRNEKKKKKRGRGWQHTTWSDNIKTLTAYNMNRLVTLAK